MTPAVRFDGVWKKFRRGERHDSLRDLIPSLIRKAFRAAPTDELRDQEFWALQDVSFEVAPGEALGIIGPNGAGKSTTLKLLTKILRPTRGACEIRGRAGALIEVAAGFHPDLTGRENVFLQGAILGMRRVEIAEKFDRIVAFAGMGDFIDTPVKRYSSGMNARLGFAIAAHINPDVLIIDEVLAVGDMEFQRRCNERMIALKQEGVALVLVSHNLAAIRTLCDRALLLKKGAVEYLGPTELTLQRYAGSAGVTGVAPQHGGDTIEIESVALPRDRDAMQLQPGDAISVRLRVPRSAVRAEAILVTYLVEQQTQAVAHNSNRPLPLAEYLDNPDGVELVVSLTLNLLRGIYALSFSVFDPITQVHCWTGSATVLGVSEMFSYSGVAHLPMTVAVAPAGASAMTAAGRGAR